MGEREAWRPFLERWSREWIAGHDGQADAPLDAEVVRDSWLGFGPAGEAEVVAAEARLGRRLPPSLREFLLVTNGWRDAGAFIYRLAGTTGLAWLRDTDDRHWIEVYDDLAADDGDSYLADEATVLGRSLRLSLEGDAAVMLLDPDDVDEDGEWAAYWLASWSGEGPERHDSFHALMFDAYVGFHALRKPPGSTRDHWDAEVERARRDALAGEVDGPLAVLARAHEFGRDRADVLSMQLTGLLGEWQRGLVDLVWHGSDRDGFLLGPLFAAEILPLLFRHDQLASGYDLRPLERLREVGPEPVRELIAAYQARLAAPGFRLTFGGGPDFDAAVHAVADRLAAAPAFQAPVEPPAPTGPLVAVMYATGSGPVPERDPLSDPEQVRAARAALCDRAWPELRAALRLWQPVNDDHIAPVSLLADPVLAELITPERGREILSTPRGPARSG